MAVCVWASLPVYQSIYGVEPNMPLGEMENRASPMWKLLMAGRGPSLTLLLSLMYAVSSQRVLIGN